ncbi:hypothetical protein L2E82_35468 [Cichorium intybus]|uniref:Uncharacterized protein n=1 Tax=Cichorium intybus TaxID=13427 RepID=A0ACB9BNV9_CICIN|nr:hypothetical protein L2E82_35468 [Cichorium intybus]
MGESKASIDYDSVSKILNVSFTGFRDNIDIVQVGLHHVIDLRDVLPEWVIFGFSAATEHLFEKNNVRSWTFNSSVLQVDETNGPVKGKKGTSGYMVGLIAGACVVVALLAMVAILCWQKRKTKGDVAEEFTTTLAGTLGYMAPECAATGKASRESDVFSFGVVALEIACGRKPITHKALENQIRLVEWVWELYGTGTLLEAADPRLGSDYEEEEVKRLMIVGLWCVHPDPHLRPPMSKVIQVLKYEASLPILPSKMPVASYLFYPMSTSFGIASIIQTQSSSRARNTDS